MKLTAVEVDAATGQSVERPFTPDEIAQREADQQAAQAAADEATAKVAARDAALAKLAALGLTVDDLSALGF
jgi:hypothetical protein